MKNKVDTGTVHRYQGDEKHVMIMDIPDSYGEKRAGIFLDADHVDDSGAMLFNVAVSRSKKTRPEMLQKPLENNPPL